MMYFSASRKIYLRLIMEGLKSFRFLIFSTLIFKLKRRCLYSLVKKKHTSWISIILHNLEGLIRFYKADNNSEDLLVTWLTYLDSFPKNFSFIFLAPYSLVKIIIPRIKQFRLSCCQFCLIHEKSSPSVWAKSFATWPPRIRKSG